MVEIDPYTQWPVGRIAIRRWTLRSGESGRAVIQRINATTEQSLVNSANLMIPHPPRPFLHNIVECTHELVPAEKTDGFIMLLHMRQLAAALRLIGLEPGT